MIEKIKTFGIVLALVLSGLALLSGGNSAVGTYVASDITSITNPWTFASTLGITGAATLSSTLDVDGETTVDGLTEGGGTVTITPTSDSVTLTQANLLAGNVITFTASTTMPALTVTLPATSTMTTLLASSGDTRSWMIENPFTGSATTTTIAAGTGIDLQEPDGQNVVIGINNYAWLTCFREASTDVVCRVDETIPAD